MRIERRWAGVATLAMAGLLALGCSDDDNGGGGDTAAPRQDAATTTVNLAEASDTPFCNEYVEAITVFQDGMNNEAVGGGEERASTLLEQFKSSYEEAAALAPADGQADLQAADAFVQSLSSWVDLLRLSDNELAVLGRVNGFVNTTCNLDLETSPRPIG